MSSKSKPVYLPVALAVSCVLLVLFTFTIVIGNYMNSLEVQAKKSQKYLDLAKALAGYNSPQNTLLLLANNAELRTGGGFIGTVGAVRSDQGKISPDQLIGVYSIDATNTCTNIPYSPPDYLKKIGPCASLRDSSNQLDFASNAKQAMYYYQQVIHKPVENVVQFTPSVLEELLAKLGPVYLKEYDLTVNRENFRDTVQLEVESGQDKLQKKDPKSGILGSLANQLMARLISKDLVELRSYLPVLQEMINQKQLVMYSANPNTQKLIESVGAAGDVRKTSENYLMITEANIAANKSSPYIRNLVDMNQVVNTDGTSTIDLKIQTNHTSDYKISYVDPNIPQERRWLVGDDYSYIKLVLPEDSQILSSSLEKDRLSIEQAYNKQILGYYRSIKPLGSSTVTFRYSVPTKYIFGSQLTINTLIQKQTGGWPYDLRYSLKVPAGYSLKASSVAPLSQTVGEESRVMYTDEIITDSVLSFIYEKN